MRGVRGFLVMVAVLGLSNGAMAQDPLWQDNIGIFTDDGQHYEEGVVGYGYAYLVLMDMTCPNGVAGWECRLETTGDAAITAVDYGLGIDADSDLLGFAVGLAEVLPYSDRLRLCEIEYFTLGGTGEIYVYPNRTPSLPDVAVYVDGADPLHKIAMYHWYANEWSLSLFTVNFHFSPTASSSWGEVKALFR